MSEIDLRQMEAGARAAKMFWKEELEALKHGVTDAAHTHIANCSPPTILAMIARLEKAEAERNEAWAAIRANDECEEADRDARPTVCGVCKEEFPTYDAWNTHADLVHITEDQRQRIAAFTGRDAT